MKLNKSKNKTKGKNKVHPSPFTPSSSSSLASLSLAPLNDPMKTLNLLLPATILALISTLPLSDCEVLAYMLIHSLKSSPIIETKQKDNKKKLLSSHCFECDCFYCYTNYWYRWDLSPHRELIHQAIEAFEEHLATNEVPKKGKKKEKVKKDAFLRVGTEKDPILQVGFVKDPILEAGIKNGCDPVEIRVGFGVGGADDGDDRENGGGDVDERGSCDGDVDERGRSSGDGGDDVEERESRGGKLVLRGEEHKGLARKMLPDVIGLLNSRLWNLWGPNV